MKSIKDYAPKDRLVLSTFIKLIRAAESVSSRSHKHLSKVKLSFGQFAVLEALYHSGLQCQKDLAEKILKTPRNITMIVDNLEKRELVSRKRNIGDRRYWDIHLTENGKQLFEDIFPEHLKSIHEQMDILSEQELKSLGDLCRVLGKSKRQSTHMALKKESK